MSIEAVAVAGAASLLAALILCAVRRGEPPAESYEKSRW
jgi:hypothetical protein